MKKEEKEEEVDEQQIRDARADYKKGKFTRVRALIKKGSKKYA